MIPWSQAQPLGVKVHTYSISLTTSTILQFIIWFPGDFWRICTLPNLHDHFLKPGSISKLDEFVGSVHLGLYRVVPDTNQTIRLVSRSLVYWQSECRIGSHTGVSNKAELLVATLFNLEVIRRGIPHSHPHDWHPLLLIVSGLL